MDTLLQYNIQLDGCKDIFLRKTADYGTAWRVLRTISVTDQIYIKAWRIRTLQEKKVQLVADDIPAEFKGIVNYAIIGLIQLELPGEEPEELSLVAVTEKYEEQAATARKLMLEKNHDYGEAWRNMSQEALTDLILMKLLRIRQILENDGKTLISEGIDANYHDIINYALFALVLHTEKNIPV
jgi:Nucleotide modification associated domain 1